MGAHRRYAEELAYVNAVSCLLVILIHVLSLGISMAEPTSWQLAVIYFPWRLSAFVVPAFLFSGGVKMSLAFGDRFDGREYLRYLWGRVKKIYLPYLVWNIIYFVRTFFLMQRSMESGQKKQDAKRAIRHLKR